MNYIIIFFIATIALFSNELDLYAVFTGKKRYTISRKFITYDKYSQ